jgi:hypothetical protein
MHFMPQHIFYVTNMSPKGKSEKKEKPENGDNSQ